MKIDRTLSTEMLKLALTNGATEAEVFQRASRMLSAEVKSGEVSAVESAVSMGYGIRVIADGRPGFYYSTQPAEAEFAVKAAVETARFAEKDERMSFPEPKEANDIEVYDKSIASISEQSAIECAMSVEKGALSADDRVKSTRKAMASFNVSETLVANSKGVSFSYPSTSVSAHIMTVAEEGGESQMGWGFDIRRFLGDIKFEAVGAESSKKATMMLGAQNISSKKAAVVLDSHVAADFLSIFSSMLSSENVQKGKSLLAGKVGQKVIAGELDIIDDGLLREGPGARPIDDEGTPVSKKTLIGGGVLEGFMYNARTAGREGRESSGNAVRGRFSGVPSVGPLNLYITASKEAVGFEDMISSVKQGLYIIEVMGMHTANPISGQFSIGVSGLWIEEGEFRFPVKEAVISGNILDFFSRVVSVGNDLRFYGNVGSPSLLVGETDISG